MLIYMYVNIHVVNIAGSARHACGCAALTFSSLVSEWVPHEHLVPGEQQRVCVLQVASRSKALVINLSSWRERVANVLLRVANENVYRCLDPA